MSLVILISCSYVYTVQLFFLISVLQLVRGLIHFSYVLLEYRLYIKISDVLSIFFIFKQYEEANLYEFVFLLSRALLPAHKQVFVHTYNLKKVFVTLVPLSLKRRT